MDSPQTIRWQLESQQARLQAILDEQRPAPVAEKKAEDAVAAALIVETCKGFRQITEDATVYIVKRENDEIHHVEAIYTPEEEETKYVYYVDGLACNTLTIAGASDGESVHKDGTFDIQLKPRLGSSEVAIIRMGPRSISQGTRTGRSVRYGHGTYCNADLGITVREDDDAPKITAITDAGKDELEHRIQAWKATEALERGSRQSRWCSDQMCRARAVQKKIDALLERWYAQFE